MRKIILTLVGAALVAGSTTQVAFSKERHHVRSVQQFCQRLCSAFLLARCGTC